MEVCVDSVQSALNAQKGGAIRVELCANLLEGGTTPSIGMLLVIKQQISIPVFVMIRPRGGDFCYSPVELEVMKEDIISLKKAGADGFVFGILTVDGEIDTARCKDLLDVALPMQSTFHRAIDMTKDIHQSLIKIMELGFQRVLSSGGCPDALQGANTLKEMVKQAKGKLIIMPGGGIRLSNLKEILSESGAEEFHGSARELVDSSMTYRKSDLCMGSQPDMEFIIKVTSAQTVRFLVDTATTLWQEVNST